MKRLALVLSVLFLLASIVSGCGSATSENATTATTAATTEKAQTATTAAAAELEGKITYTTWMSNIADNKLQDLLNKFTDANPKVTIDMEVVTDNSIMKTRMAANELADVTFLPEPAKVSRKDFPQYFQPIDDFGFTAEDLYFFNSGVGEDGKLYLISDGVMYDGVVYDKKTFAAAGIKSVPKTKEELFAACDLLKVKGIIPFATCFKDAWGLSVWANPQAVVGFTGDVNAINNLAKTDTLLSDENGNLQAMKLIKEIVDRGYAESDLMADTWDGDCKGLGSGRYAMMHMASWMPPALPAINGCKIEDIGMFTFPGVKVVRLGDTGGFWGIAKNSKNPVVAKAFLKWMWVEGKYYDVAGFGSPLKKGESSFGFVTELLSAGIPTVENVANSAEYTEILAKSEISDPSIIQEYILSKNPEEVVKKYNDIWANARKAVAK